MLASPLTATIYLPLLSLLAEHFQVSLQSVNLTVTIYIISQAISPFLFATSSDTFGRRPIFLILYSIYTVASLGLALNKTSYAALLVLRAVQSLGASAVLAVAYGVVADICITAERGAMLGPMMGMANLVVCIGPVIGGWIALGGSHYYQWVFWALFIFGAKILTVVGFLFPETARNLVAKGSIPPKTWSITWYSLIRTHIKTILSRPTEDRSKEESELGVPSDQRNQQQQQNMAKRECRVPNPLNYLSILFWKDTAGILWMAASPYAVYYCLQASIPSIYKDTSGFSELKIGLSYLPGGVGVVDLFSSSPSTAAAASNITRCALSTVAVAVMQTLVDAMEIGWFFTLLALISGGGGLAANLAITRYGIIWRGQRLAKTRR